MTLPSLRRRFIAACLLGAAILPLPAAALDIEGISFDDSITVDGSRLLLNGVGWRKRGYFKVDVTGLYLGQKASTIEAVEAMPGPKRLQLVILQELTGATASRYFVADFEAAATKDEFRTLLNEVFLVGQVYSSLPKLKKGDVVAMDILPGKGLATTINGQSVMVPGTDSRFIKSDLMGRIFLRMFIGGRTPAELRDNLLGISRSMRGG